MHLVLFQNTQISDADPRTCQRAHTFHIKTLSVRYVSEMMLAADSKEQLTMWFDGLQQHLLDQGELLAVFLFLTLKMLSKSTPTSST